MRRRIVQIFDALRVRDIAAANLAARDRNRGKRRFVQQVAEVQKVRPLLALLEYLRCPILYGDGRDHTGFSHMPATSMRSMPGGRGTASSSAVPGELARRCKPQADGGQKGVTQSLNNMTSTVVKLLSDPLMKRRGFAKTGGCSGAMGRRCATRSTS